MHVTESVVGTCQTCGSSTDARQPAYSHELTTSPIGLKSRTLPRERSPRLPGTLATPHVRQHHQTITAPTAASTSKESKHCSKTGHEYIMSLTAPPAHTRPPQPYRSARPRWTQHRRRRSSRGETTCTSASPLHPASIAPQTQTAYTQIGPSWRARGGHLTAPHHAGAARISFAHSRASRRRAVQLVGAPHYRRCDRYDRRVSGRLRRASESCSATVTRWRRGAWRGSGRAPGGRWR